MTVKKGTVHGFLGPNGAGKTTTIKILMDFIRPTKGEVSIMGQPVYGNNKALHHSIGYLSGDMSLYDNLTGDQYLRYISYLRGNKDYKHAKKLCDNLEPVLDRKIGTLSRGNKQKIGLVAALMDDPELLILDEPTTGLDPIMQQKFYAVLQDYAKRGKTVFMSSHILSEIQEVCETVTFMKNGQIIKTIDTGKLLDNSKRHIRLIAAPSRTLSAPLEKLQTYNTKQTKKEISFDVDEVSPALLRWIATQPIRDVTITEPTLDNVFLGMYEEEVDI